MPHSSNKSVLQHWGSTRVSIISVHNIGYYLRRAGCSHSVLRETVLVVAAEIAHGFSETVLLHALLEQVG